MSTAATFRFLSPLRSTLSRSPKLRPSSAARFRHVSPIYSQHSRRLFSQTPLMQEKKYTDQHEWIELASDGSTASIGITEYAANALGDVVFVELPAVESEVSAGESIGAVESVKSASDILSPITGTVVESNTVLEERPKTINESPEADGWITKIKVADMSELDGLKDAKAYQAMLEEGE